jgi:hypothetical protein
MTNKDEEDAANATVSSGDDVPSLLQPRRRRSSLPVGPERPSPPPQLR